MALPLSDPPAPGHQPQIQVVSGLQLTEGQAALLQQAFADHHKVLVEKQFLSGYSGATTYLVTLDGYAPVVVKLAPRSAPNCVANFPA